VGRLVGGTFIDTGDNPHYVKPPMTKHFCDITPLLQNSDIGSFYIQSVYTAGTGTGFSAIESPSLRIYIKYHTGPIHYWKLLQIGVVFISET